MKSIKTLLVLLTFGMQLNAEIQDGKVVAGAIVICNYSLRSVKINGYELKSGRMLYLNLKHKRAMERNISSYRLIKGLITGTINEYFWIESDNDLDRLFNKNCSFTLTLCYGDKVLDIPLVDTQKPSIEFGRYFNRRLYFGCDLRGNELEFDITIHSKYLGFGQDVKIGERFKEAQTQGQQVIESFDRFS